MLHDNCLQVSGVDRCNELERAAGEQCDPSSLVMAVQGPVAARIECTASIKARVAIPCLHQRDEFKVQETDDPMEIRSQALDIERCVNSSRATLVAFEGSGWRRES